MNAKSIKTEFMENAENVSAFLYEVKNIKEAFLRAIDLCEKKQSCINLYDTENKIKISNGRKLESCSDPVPDSKLKYKLETKRIQDSEKIIAAPGLSDDKFEEFKLLCREKGINLIKTGLRQYPGGIDLGFTSADFGIAETGSLVINSDNEDTRLASMLSELHVALLPESKIRPTAIGMAKELKELIDRPSSYISFITGASRTADIERVLAIGVHGPLELHIIILIGE